jgi:hypothetical protein
LTDRKQLPRFMQSVSAWGPSTSPDPFASVPALYACQE